MESANGFSEILNKLKAYKKKYYLNVLLKGLIISAAVLITAYLVVNSLESGFRFNSTIRALLFFSFVAAGAYVLYRLIIRPLYHLANLNKALSNEDAARQIGQHFPGIHDKLLNALQLQQTSQQDNSLIAASIQQRTQQLSAFKFEQAVQLSTNRRYLKFLAGPFVVLLLLLLITPSFLLKSTNRIINYSQDFTPAPDFAFVLAQPTTLLAFRNEDKEVVLQLEGQNIPQDAYLVSGGRRIKMRTVQAGTFAHTFEKLRADVNFDFAAAGYNSQSYTLKVVDRPNLKGFNVALDYPAYLGRSAETFSNAGNLTVPEGTQLKWQFFGFQADSLELTFTGQPKETLPVLKDGSFEYGKQMRSSTGYSIRLKNQYSLNKAPIAYTIQVIKDQYPKINLERFQDTTLYNLIVLGGNVSDDHGLSSLKLHYKFGQQEKYSQVRLNISPGQKTQSYYYNWALDSMALQKGQTIEYYLEVKDNDGINGAKATRTPLYRFKVPSQKELQEQIRQGQAKVQKDLEESLKQAREMKQKLKEASDKLKAKKNLSWKDKQMLEQLIAEQQKIAQQIEELKKNQQDYKQKNERFNQNNEDLNQKNEQLEEVLQEMQNDELQQLMDELQELLDDDDIEEIRDKLNKANDKQQSVEKDLKRTLELFKRLKVETELAQLKETLESLAEQQEALAEENLTEGEPTDNEELSTQEEGQNAEQEAQGEEGQEGTENQEGAEGNTEEGNEGQQENQEGESGQEGSQGQEQEGESQEGNQNQEEGKEGSQNQEGSQNEQEGQQGNQQQGQQEQQNGQQSQQGKQEGGQEKNSAEQKQEELNKAFEEFQEQLEKVKELNQELKNPQSIDDTKRQEESVKKAQQQSLQQLQQNQQQKAGQKQKQAGERMKELGEQLQKMQSGMQMEQLNENIGDLSNILDNLITLSKNQEDLMNKFRQVNQSDPQYVNYSQQQLKLKDDSRVLEDSLIALSERVFQIKSFITRELEEMNRHIDGSTEQLKDRRLGKATSEQQLAMTSMNNLALLLNNVLSQMQQQLSDAMGGSSSMPMPENGEPSLGQQQQQLNQQIQELKQSGKSGRALSEGLAKLAAEQERIRKALKEQLEQQGMEVGEQQGSGQEAVQKMEQTELDLVNKRINAETIRRQEEILTRLLEAEESLREQETDEERKGETANGYERSVPPAFEEYIRNKQKEIELLRTVPIKLNDYFKVQVQGYFERINNGNDQ